MNSTVEEFDRASLHVLLRYPNAFEIGVSKQGIQILFGIVNANPQWLGERSYCSVAGYGAIISRR